VRERDNGVRVSESERVSVCVARMRERDKWEGETGEEMGDSTDQVRESERGE